MAEKKLPLFEGRIIILSDGRVVFEHLTEELLAVATDLNPDAPQVIARTTLAKEFGTLSDADQNAD